MLKGASHAIVNVDCILVYVDGNPVRLPNTLDVELQCYNTAIARVTPLVKGKLTADLEKIPTENVIQLCENGILYSLSAEYDVRITEYRNGNLRNPVWKER